MARDPALQPPRGTRDFYPEDLRLRSWLFDHFREVARRFAFEEVDAPVVEHAELFIRKAGEEIVDQLYHFELHDRHLALRPELTPSISRMVIARAGALRFPLRWFAIGQNWRYERTTRGRKREHYQWNAEILGEPSVSAEAELISAIFTLLERVGLPADAVRMRVNHRGLLEETLRDGILRERPEAFEPLCVVIDKLDKIGAEAVTELLVKEISLSPEAAREVVAGLAVKSLDEAAARAPEGSTAVADLRRLFELLDAYGLSDRVVFDASVVRGLAYYTGIVFEAFDAAGELRAVCGGGRYDRLIEQLGGPALPAVGFGMGDVVIQELLADQGRLPELPREIDALVFAVTEAERPAAVRAVRALREAGRAADLVLGTPRMKRALQDADRAGARELWVVGADELGRGVARVRDLASGEQRDEPLPG